MYWCSMHTHPNKGPNSSQEKRSVGVFWCSMDTHPIFHGWTQGRGNFSVSEVLCRLEWIQGQRIRDGV